MVEILDTREPGRDQKEEAQNEQGKAIIDERRICWLPCQSEKVGRLWTKKSQDKKRATLAIGDANPKLQ